MQTSTQSEPLEDVEGSHELSMATNHLNVEEELSFYASYHSNKINQLIHFFCIPQILWSWLIVAAHVTLPDAKLFTLTRGLAFQPSLALAFITSYMTYYTLLDPIGGITYIPVGSLLYLTATYLATSPPTWLPLTSPGEPSAIPFALVVHGLAWIAQFIGHGVFEHRAPALLDNLVQALVLAPFFVHLEALFAFFNYKPDLHKKIKARAGLRIRDMNRQKSRKAE